MLKVTQRGRVEADLKLFPLGHVILLSSFPERGLTQRDVGWSMFRGKSRMKKLCLSRSSQWTEEYDRS